MTNQHLQLALTDRPATRVGNGFAPGSFGELLQGVSPDDGRDFLVTLPLSIGAHATFTPDATLPDVQVAPARKRKSLAVARRALALLGAPPGGALTIDSSLPEGKGLASSSADLVATVRAVADATTRRSTRPPSKAAARCRADGRGHVRRDCRLLPP